MKTGPDLQFTNLVLTFMRNKWLQTETFMNKLTKKKKTELFSIKWVTNLSRMNHQGNMAIHVGGKLSESSNDRILFDKTLTPLWSSNPHHELQVIQYHMSNIVDINCMWHSLDKCKITDTQYDMTSTNVKKHGHWQNVTWSEQTL